MDTRADKQALYRLLELMRFGFSEQAAADPGVRPPHLAAFLFLRVVLAFERARAQVRRMPQVTAPERMVLGAVWDNGPMAVSELATAVDLPRSSTSELVDRLVQRGMLSRSDDPRDRRRVLVELAPQAMAGPAPALFHAATMVTEYLDGQPDELLQLVIDGLSEAHQQLSKAGDAMASMSDDELRATLESWRKEMDQYAPDGD